MTAMASGPDFLPDHPVACATDPELFDARRQAERDEVYEARKHKARLLCGRCPVRQPCLEWALRNRVAGLAGGMSQTERTGERNRRQLPAPAERYETVEQTDRRLRRAVIPQLLRNGLTGRDISVQLGVQLKVVERDRDLAGIRHVLQPLPREIRSRKRRGKAAAASRA